MNITGALTDGSTGKLALTQDGAGITGLENSGNNFSGATIVSKGILQVGSATAASSLGAGGAVSVGNGSTLLLVSLANTLSNQISNGLGGVGTVNIDSVSLISNTLSGALTNGAKGTLALSQIGIGTTILTNAGATLTVSGTGDSGALDRTAANITPTPEPGSALLLSRGAGTLLGWRKRRGR